MSTCCWMRFVWSTVMAMFDMSVLYLDLNNFKQVNENYGHAVGDEILRAMAECLIRYADSAMYHVK